MQPEELTEIAAQLASIQVLCLKLRMSSATHSRDIIQQPPSRALEGGYKSAVYITGVQSKHRRTGGNLVPAHLAEGDLRLVAIFGIQVVCQLNRLPHMPFIHQLQLPIVGEGMPVDDTLSYGILYSLQRDCHTAIISCPVAKHLSVSCA